MRIFTFIINSILIFLLLFLLFLEIKKIINITTLLCINLHSLINFNWKIINDCEILDKQLKVFEFDLNLLLNENDVYLKINASNCPKLEKINIDVLKNNYNGELNLFKKFINTLRHRNFQNRLYNFREIESFFFFDKRR